MLPGTASTSTAHSAAGSSQVTAVPSAISGMTGVVSGSDAGAAAASVDPLAGAVAAGAAVELSGVTASSGRSRAISSRVIGPRRYDMAHRVPNSAGSIDRVECCTNSRLARPLMRVESTSTSAEPAAVRSPSISRALSCSVWSRPIHQVPALEMAL